MTRQMEKLVEWVEGQMSSGAHCPEDGWNLALRYVREHIYALEVEKDLRKEDREWNKRQRRSRKGHKKAD